MMLIMTEDLSPNMSEPDKSWMCSSIVMSARRALAHFDNQLKLSIELGYADDIAHARRNIACAKLNYEG